MTFPVSSPLGGLETTYDVYLGLIGKCVVDFVLVLTELYSVGVTAEGLRAKADEQDAQLSQRDRAAGCVIVFAKSRRLELGDNILRTLYVYLQPL